MLSCLRLIGVALILLCYQVKALRIPFSSLKKVLIPSVASVIVGFGNYMPVEAAEPPEIKCKIFLKDGFSAPSSDKLALYLTAREDVGILTGG